MIPTFEDPMDTRPGQITRLAPIPSRMEVALVELILAARQMRWAANQLWWAHNPLEVPDRPRGDGPPSVEDAQEAHSAAFARLQKAEYRAEGTLPVEMTIPESQA
jgi:hypothetical protein